MSLQPLPVIEREGLYMLTRYTEITAGGRTYRLDRDAKAVFKERAELQHMTSQQLQLLAFFVSHPQHMLITQKQLREHLYGNTPVNPEAVPVAVKSLRKVLGDGFIQTDHGKGYRFVAEIKHLQDEYSNHQKPTQEHVWFADTESKISSDDPFADKIQTALNIKHPIDKSDLELCIWIGLFRDGGHHSAEFENFCDHFLQICFEVGYHNVQSFHVGGDFSIIRHWQVPLEYVDEVRFLAERALETFGIKCGPKLVQARNASDGRPSITFVVGKKEIAQLWDLAKARPQPPSSSH
jgi:DNA-binding winged helix-turn-helix (wHTH) protein